MAILSKSEQLFNYAATFHTFVDGFEKRVLNDIANIFNFQAYFQINVKDMARIRMTNFYSNNPKIIEKDIQTSIKQDSFMWSIEEGPYIGSCNGFSIIGVSFIQETWGVFVASKHPLAQDIQALKTFGLCVQGWYSYPQLMKERKALKEDPARIDDRKYAALKTLYSVAEWEWDINTNACMVSDAFLAFFDSVSKKETYHITDIYYLIGEDNAELFKECVNKVVETEYQVIEEFKCKIPNTNTFQHIQMLFDPIYKNDSIIQIMGYCRDNGRTYCSDTDTLKWYDSEWLHDLSLLPLEWLLHSNGDCEIMVSPLHQSMIKEDLSELMKELKIYLESVMKKGQYNKNINVTIQLPFSSYQYQLLAAKSDTDPLLWRGVLVVVSEKSVAPPSDTENYTYEEYNQQRMFKFMKTLANVEQIDDYKELLQYLIGLPRLSNDEYAFEDFWAQLNDIVRSHNKNTTLNHKIPDNFRMPYAQWVLSLMSFILRYFQLEHAPISVQCIEPAIVESQSARVIEANHVVEIKLTTQHIAPVSKMVQLFLQVAMIGVGIDMRFESNQLEWTCVLYAEVKSFQQPGLMNSQILNDTSETHVKKTVLIVDDDQYNTQTLEVLFHSDGFRTVSANQGQQALRLIDTMTDLDIVMLDIKMPNMDGFEVMERIRKNPKNDLLPVIIISANINPIVTERLRPFNVAGIVEKPFDIDALINNVNSVIEKNKQLKMEKETEELGQTLMPISG
jgi:CheY-like chemotaxis protein